MPCGEPDNRDVQPIPGPQKKDSKGRGSEGAPCCRSSVHTPAARRCLSKGTEMLPIQKYPEKCWDSSSPDPCDRTGNSTNSHIHEAPVAAPQHQQKYSKSLLAHLSGNSRKRPDNTRHNQPNTEPVPAQCSADYWRISPDLQIPERDLAPAEEGLPKSQ